MVKVALPALAVLIGLGLLVLHRHGLGIDHAAYDVIEPLESRPGRQAVRVFTDIGSFPVVMLVAWITAFVAYRAGRLQQAVALSVGVVAVVILNSVAKDIWDRPRPVDRFYDPLGSSFPSGHSAQAITWLAAARVLDKRPLLIAAPLLVLAIGGSRLYLHVHYLTDVLGGFALGTAVFAPALARTSS